MFYAINATTKERVNTIKVNFSNEFFYKEKWLVDPLEIEEYDNTKINLSTIEVKYRKKSKDIITTKGNIYFRNPHFYIPNATELGIKTKP